MVAEPSDPPDNFKVVHNDLCRKSFGWCRRNEHKRVVTKVSSKNCFAALPIWEPYFARHEIANGFGRILKLVFAFENEAAFFPSLHTFDYQRVFVPHDVNLFTLANTAV